MRYPPSINASTGQGDKLEMTMVGGCMVFGAGVGANKMSRIWIKEGQLRSQYRVTKTILTVISGGMRWRRQWQSSLSDYIHTVVGSEASSKRGKNELLAGTVYKILGFGFSADQFSKIERNDEDFMPSASVSTSTVEID